MTLQEHGRTVTFKLQNPAAVKWLIIYQTETLADVAKRALAVLLEAPFWGNSSVPAENILLKRNINSLLLWFVFFFSMKFMLIEKCNMNLKSTLQPTCEWRGKNNNVKQRHYKNKQRFVTNFWLGNFRI